MSISTIAVNATLIPSAKNTITSDRIMSVLFVYESISPLENANHARGNKITKSKARAKFVTTRFVLTFSPAVHSSAFSIVYGVSMCFCDTILSGEVTYIPSTLQPKEKKETTPRCKTLCTFPPRNQTSCSIRRSSALLLSTRLPSLPHSDIDPPSKIE